MTKYKALPVDAIHPRFGTLMQFLLPKEPELKESNWLLPVYATLGNLSGALPALSSECKAANAKNPYLCLDVNESLPFVKTPTFLVQQTPSVWDFQCLFGGWYNPGFILQVDCSYEWPSRRVHGYKNIHKCTQYDDLCTLEYVADFVVPLQKTYLQQVEPTATKAGNGGFVHSCYLGSYFNENFGTTSPKELPRAVDGVWNQIAIGGVTMQQAIATWWALGDSASEAVWSHDDGWNATNVAPKQPPVAAAVGAPTPVVPWYSNHYMTNPSCRGYPWY
jgi:hypothetical protein